LKDNLLVFRLSLSHILSLVCLNIRNSLFPTSIKTLEVSFIRTDAINLSCAIEGGISGLIYSPPFMYEIRPLGQIRADQYAREVFEYVGELMLLTLLLCLCTLQ
jgi:hypothetical protein